MLELIIVKIHDLLNDKINPYRLESNKHAITISFNDLVKNSINIRINLKEFKFRYFIMNESKEWKSISKSVLKMLMNTLIEKPTFSEIMELIEIY